MRKVHIEKQIWLYSVGSQFVTIRDPEGKRTSHLASEVNRRDFERGQHKRTSDGMIYPSDVKTFILTNMITYGKMCK